MMSRWSRRRVLVAAAVLPVPVTATSASALTAPGVPRPGVPQPGGAPVADPEPVVDPAEEIGGTASAGDTAAGVIRPVPATTGRIAVGRSAGGGRTTTEGRAGSGDSTAAADGAVAAGSTSSVPFSFTSAAFTINRLAPGSRPYAQSPPCP